MACEELAQCNCHTEAVREKGTGHVAVAMCGLCICLRGDKKHSSDKSMDTGLS